MLQFQDESNLLGTNISIGDNLCVDNISLGYVVGMHNVNLNYSLLVMALFLLWL
jgi:hypothetical protein